MNAGNGNGMFRLHRLSEIEEDLAQQRSRLERGYRDDPTGATAALAEFDIARAAYLQRYRRDHLQDYGTLVPDSINTNPLHVVRLVSADHSSPFEVVRVEGNLGGMGERAVLSSFLSRGLPCVTPLYEGSETVAVNGSSANARVFSTLYILGAMPLGKRYSLDKFAERVAIVAGLTEFLARFYGSGATLEQPSSWMTMRKEWVRGTETPMRRDLTLALAALEDLDGHPEVTLHGNPHENNVIEDSSRKWWLLDPGHLVGPPDGEIGWMVSDFARHPAEIRNLVNVAAMANPKLDHTRLLRFAGVSSVLRAYRPEQFRGVNGAEEWRTEGLDLINSTRGAEIAQHPGGRSLERSL